MTSEYEMGRQLGRAAYTEATDDQKTLIAFGMIDKTLIDQYGIKDGDEGQGFAVGLMEAATTPGGKGMVC